MYDTGVIRLECSVIEIKGLSSPLDSDVDKTDLQPNNPVGNQRFACVHSRGNAYMAVSITDRTKVLSIKPFQQRYVTSSIVVGEGASYTATYGSTRSLA